MAAKMLKDDKRRVKMALIGCGEHAVAVLHNSLTFIDSIEVVAVCDLNEERASFTARRFGLNSFYTDVDEMLEETNAEAALVVTLPDLQQKLTQKCMQAGLHVYCEKPLVTEREEAQKILELAEENPGLHVQVGFQKRFQPYVGEIKKIISKEEFGKPSYAFAKFANGYRPRTKDLMRVGGIHAFDLTRYLIGEVEEVFSYAYEEGEGKISISVNTKFENGAIGSYFISSLGTWCSRGVESLEIRGDRNAINLDNVRELTWQRPPEKVGLRGPTGTTQGLQEVPSPLQRHEPNYSHVSGVEYQTVYQNGYAQALESFAEGILQDTKPTPTIIDGIKALEIALAIEESLETNKSVSLQKNMEYYSKLISN